MMAKVINNIMAAITTSNTTITRMPVGCTTVVTSEGIVPTANAMRMEVAIVVDTMVAIFITTRCKIIVIANTKVAMLLIAKK